MNTAVSLTYKKLMQIVAFIAMASLAVSAQAQYSNYGGNQDKEKKTYLLLGIGSAAVDSGIDSSSYLSFAVGRKVSKKWGLELQHAYVFAADVENTTDTTATLNNLGLSVLRYYEFTDSLQMFIRGGVLFWDKRISGSGARGDDANGITFGFGLNYDINDRWGLTGSYNRHDAFNGITTIGIGGKFKY